MPVKKAKERQNQVVFDTYAKKGGVALGPHSTYVLRNDPRHLCFLLSRYKFVGKMLEGRKEVLEIGCGDALGISLMLQSVGKVVAIDAEPFVIEDNIKRSEYGRRCSFQVLDITARPANRKFDSAFALDVIEHIPKRLENKFMKNIASSLKKDAVCIIGTPNITARRYATKISAIGHVNLKSSYELKKLISRYFKNVFIFSMNDEVVHTGYKPMAHYLFGMGVGLL